MLHQLLPTQERVARTNPKLAPECQVGGCDKSREDLPHALVLCAGNDGVGSRMMSCLRQYCPNLEVEAALRLELDVDEVHQLPLVWLVATVCSVVWKLRIEKSRVKLYDVRAQLEARINLLRETRISPNATVLLDQFVATYFQ